MQIKLFNIFLTDDGTTEAELNRKGNQLAEFIGDSVGFRRKWLQSHS